MILGLGKELPSILVVHGQAEPVIHIDSISLKKGLEIKGNIFPS
jgi:hypothetical protein